MRVWTVATDLDVFELEHVPLDKSASDLLIGPRDEKLVIVVGLETHKGSCNQLYPAQRQQLSNLLC